MKHLILTTIAAVLLVGCGPSAPDISIHKAASDGNIEAVKQHLAAGVDVNAWDEDFGWTPLHLAAQRGYKEIIELLLANGADVNARDWSGETPLDWADGETVDLLRKHGGKTKKELNELLNAAGEGDIKAVKQHLAAGADVNAKDENGWTPLHWAAISFDKEVSEYLITMGADVNAAETVSGMTPLHFAAAGDQKEIVELLLASGADVNAKDEPRTIKNGKRVQGSTPLDTANDASHPEIADLLRKHGGKKASEL
jgi:ankyrin repeat protein